jgi:hypothetical protein
MNVSGEYSSKKLWDKLGSLYQLKYLVNKLFLINKLYLLRMKFIPVLSFHLTINNNVAATNIKRRNTMHKNTRSILGNPSQQGKKTQPNPLLYSST